jgi:hypothetical protein
MIDRALPEAVRIALSALKPAQYKAERYPTQIA